ncbi:DUF2617 family protein [Actinomadura viridis]|uniref:DUF2617 family protein n=1 Tax=Actinomadura viridis TaxID=58110 RepID=A0A931GHF2_9ACTN|nr:DUF2617 family protein [Actinomadura viridis]MBG6087320.1 hypothetical protein [Actinomadura viridis]
MLASLDTPYADTRADALSFALGLPRLDALAVLAVPPARPGGPAVELRLLGASHQVFAGSFSETVACLPGDPRPVPGRMRANAGGWAYDFSAATEAHDGDGPFRRAVAELRDRLAGRADALTGTFPGSPYAITALALARDGEPYEPFVADEVRTPPAGPAAPPSAPWTGWQTWHAYPQTREIVMTRSRLVRAL